MRRAMLGVFGRAQRAKGVDRGEKRRCRLDNVQR